MDNFPYKSFPTGWFQLDWSDNLAPGEVKRLHVFGQDVVLYRAEAGDVRVVDAVCPHLGAHLGHGGSVKGNCLVCPFHGWEFGLDGANTHIPFLERANPRVRLKQWTVEENSGLVIVWHDELGREPMYAWNGAPELLDRANWYDLDTEYIGIRRVLPHQDKENGPDLFHFPFVHGSGEPMEIVGWDSDSTVLKIDYHMGFGVGRESTRLTPDGPVTAVVNGEGILGLGTVRFHFSDISVTQIVGITPVTKNESMLFSTTCGRRQPDSPEIADGRTRFFMEAQHTQIKSDFQIWEHQTWIDRPPLSGHEERYFLAYRQWLRQFFPDADEVVNERGERVSA